jgi:hypothetical protein
VGVAERGVGHQQRLLGLRPLGEFLRAELLQPVARARRDRRAEIEVRGLRLGQGPTVGATLHLGAAVHDDVAQEAEHLRGPVALGMPADQVGRRVDERRGGRAPREFRVDQHVLEERDVRLHAADAEFAEAAVHALDGLVEGRGEGGDLDEQRIVVGRDHRAAVSGAAVQPDAEAGGRAVVGDPSEVRNELVLRILGRHAALHREPAGVDLLLRRDPDRRVVHRQALGDQDLRPDEVDAGHHLRDRVLDLDARIDLDEVELLLVDVDQELDGRGVHELRLRDERDRGLAERLAEQRVEIRRGGDLDDLLMAPLHRAVALPEMDDLAVGVADDLHLDVLRARDVPLEEDGIVAERGARLAARLIEQPLELLGLVDHAHAAAAAAEAGLHDEREADALGFFLQSGPGLTGPSVPGRTGRPVSMASLRAATLSPNSSSTSGAVR